MILKNMIKNSTVLVSLGVLLVSCSSKKDVIDDTQIDRFYKNIGNNSIKNSKSMHKATMRSYSVFGKKYHPFVANIGDDFSGTASWYGPDFHSKKTSNGEVYNMYDLTAAHKTLPMNTMLLVHNLENGKEVMVRVNDRGPFVDGRIIDLSNSAAHKIDMVKNGTAKVKITVLGYNGELNSAYSNFADIEKINKKELAKASNIPTSTTVAVAPTVIETTNVVQTQEIIEPIKIEEVTNIADNFNIQVGAFRKVNGASQTQAKYQRNHIDKIVEIKKVFSNGSYLYKVLITGFSTKMQAQNFKTQNSLFNSIIVKN